MRIDSRNFNEIRNVEIVRDFIKHAEGSALIRIGDTKVICTATVRDDVPQFLRGKKQGWITAEYGMLPRSTETRSDRESARGKITGRTHEIQRLIGRSLRCVVDLAKVGERTILIDCDVIQADGGTRTASITGGFIALYDTISYLIKKGIIDENPIKDMVAAISVGIVDDRKMIDLTYSEDSNAEVDMNIVMTADGKFVEIQGTAENKSFSKKDLNGLLNLAKIGIKKLIKIQEKVLKWR